MNEQPYFHWDLLRQPIQPPNFGMGASFFDVNSILELRKEKSRDAARSRRGKENYEFYELAKLLPLPAAITSQLDKASIIRLSISYLRLRDFSCHGEPSWTRDMPHHKAVKVSHPRRRNHPAMSVDLFESHQGTHILQSLDGFAFILGNDARFLYISETVSIYLGLSQVEMAGSSFFDYVHQQDHSVLAEHLGMGVPPASSTGVPSPGSSEEGSPCAQRCVTPPGQDSRGYVMNPDLKSGPTRSFCLRMKSTLTKRGVHVKSSGYRVVHLLGQFRSLQVSAGVAGVKGGPGSIGLVAVGLALPPPTITELRLEHDTFITRMAPDFTLTYCEPLISEHMDLNPDDVTNRSLYDLSHAGDLYNLRQSHVDVLSKGQVMTDYYRIMTRSGGYVWVQTCATTLLNGKNADDQNILAINYVLSGVDQAHSLMSLWQTCGSDKPAPSPTLPGHVHRSRVADDKDGETTGSAVSESEPGNNNNNNNNNNKSSSSSSQSEKKEEQLKKKHSSSAGCPPSPRGNSSNNNNNNNNKTSDVADAVDNDALSDNDSPDASPGLGGVSGGSVKEKNEAVSPDCKNSRRKMERPRKRKREELESGEGEEGGGGLGGGGGQFPDSPQSGDGVGGGVAGGRKRKKGKEGEGGSGGGGGGGGRPHSRDAGASPEDLSLKSPLTSSSLSSLSSLSSSVEASAGHKSSLNLHPPAPTPLRTRPSPGPTLTEKHSSSAGGLGQWTGSGVGIGGVGGVGLQGSVGGGVTPSAVKELEAVMNRHLPFLEPGALHHSDTSARLHAGGNGNGGHYGSWVSSNSNGALTNTYPAHNASAAAAAAAAKKSAIQWVGSQSAVSSSSSTSTNSSSSVSEAMMASSFLRSLYESRESVIRSCNSSGGSGGNKGPGLCGGGGGEGPRGGGPGGSSSSSSLHDDMAATLLTPPGADPPPFSIPSIVISSNSSSSSSAHPASCSSPLSSTASSSKQLGGYGGQQQHQHQQHQVSRGGYPHPGALSLALPCGGGGGGLGEAYGMTPPSSVSPQDKLTSPFAAAAAALAYNESSHGGSCGGLGRTGLHPSPSPSSAHQNHHHLNHHHSSLVSKDAAGGLGSYHPALGPGPGAHTTPDYASAKAAYYAMSALSGHPAHGGYADVNHNTSTATYDQCARPVIPWY